MPMRGRLIDGAKRQASPSENKSPGPLPAGRFPDVRAVTSLLAALLLCLPTTAFAATPETPTEKRSDCLYRNDDASLCIRKASFNADLCRSLDHFATRSNLPPEFFARLIWRESLFRPQAVSPKGAEGIAQFMPGTARLRGLTNSFDVIAALDASSTYLDALRANSAISALPRPPIMPVKAASTGSLRPAGCRSKPATMSLPLPAASPRPGRKSHRKRPPRRSMQNRLSYPPASRWPIPAS